MNRRNFITSLLVAVPAVALGLRGKAAPAPAPKPNLGDWMRKPPTHIEAGTSLCALTPESMQILWQKTVDVYEQSPDFWENLRVEPVPFANPGHAVRRLV